MLYYWERLLLLKKKQIFFLVQLANRYAIAQDFIMHDALLRGKSSLDQLALGLDTVKVLPLIRLFPEEFEGLFTYHSPTVLTPEYILELLQFPVQMNEDERRTADMFREFIGSCSDQGWCFALISETLCGVIGPTVSIVATLSIVCYYSFLVGYQLSSCYFKNLYSKMLLVT